MDIYQELGIEPIINAAGTLTNLGGSLMPPEVLDAMLSASRSFVDIHELHQAAGARIARLCGVEAAHVCSCASAGISLMAAACMAGSDPARIHSLPDSSGMSNRFLVQRTRRNSFDHAIETAGGHLVEVDPTVEALRDELSHGRAAAVSYVHAWTFNQSSLSLEVCARTAHEFSVPLILDAAAEVPPVQNLSAFIQQGADLVVFSGGKDMRGPQASGLILGRKDLVQACAANDSPNVNGIARGMKIGKEEIAGLVKAVERYVNMDHAAQMAQYDQKISFLLDVFSCLEGVQAERGLPLGVGQLVPHIVLRWNEQEMGISAGQVTQMLRSGKPSIAVRLVELTHGQPEIWVCVQTLQKGEEQVVGQRMVDIIQTSTKLD